MTETEQEACLADANAVIESMGMSHLVVARLYKQSDWTDPLTGQVFEGDWVVEVRRRPHATATVDCDGWSPNDWAWSEMLKRELQRMR